MAIGIKKPDIFRKLVEAKDTNITELDLTGSYLNEIPQELTMLTKLTKLVLDRNPNIEDFSSLSKLENLTYLSLNKNQIEDVTFLKHLTQLKHLHLINNRIKDIQPLFNLSNLEVLDLDHNPIQGYLGINKLLNLTSLYLAFNDIKDLSPFKDLQNLKLLWLERTGVEDITPLAHLTSLEKLLLHDNNVENISALSELKKLRILTLNNNHIKDLSPIVHVIEQENVPPNLIQKLSEEDIHREVDKSLMSINLANNPLSNPPIEVVNRGKQAILTYFAEKETQGYVKISELKMLIIGEGGVGKTSLVMRLTQDPSVKLPNEGETTKGIAIQPYEFKTKEGINFKINIWDFGGQEIYHATHQFFLTKRSLYILVDDTRRDDKGQFDPVFSYWLQIVEQLSEKSPLLIVQNEKGDRSKELDMSALRGRFENIKERYKTNLLDARGVEDLKEAIEFHILQLPHVGERLPKQWFEIRRRLEQEALDKDYISLVAYLKICKENLIPERDRALFLSQYLHDLGSFLHFQDDILLKNLFILRNTWATDAVYKVLDNENVKKNYGQFTNTDLDDIWSDDHYNEKHAELLALMKRFEICYEVANPQSKEMMWLVPQLLPIEKPQFDWSNDQNLILRFEYEFMPKGLVSRFIVRMNHYLTDTNLAWRAGAIMQRENTQAWVSEDYVRREILIRVVGRQPKELMTLIVADFDEMHRSFFSLKMKKMIPCNCTTCLTSGNPNFYEFQKLQKRKDDGKEEMECDKNYDKVNVLTLLDGIFVSRSRFSKTKVREKVAVDELEDALELMRLHLPNETILLLRRYNEAKNQDNLGTETPEAIKTERQRLAKAILDFLE